MKLYVGDVLRLRKTHPCGSVEWLVLRAGMDFRVKCQGCGRVVMLPRTELERAIKTVVFSAGPPMLDSAGGQVGGQVGGEAGIGDMPRAAAPAPVLPSTRERGFTPASGDSARRKRKS